MECLADPVNVVLTVIGLLVWPELTLCIILWSLGHPILGVLALFTSFGSTKTIVQERIVCRSYGGR